MNSLIGMLKRIKPNPAAHIGLGGIAGLYFFILGYMEAWTRELSKPADVDVLFYNQLYERVNNRFLNKVSKSWADVILFHCCGNDEAFERFWECLDEFLLEHCGKDLAGIDC